MSQFGIEGFDHTVAITSTSVSIKHFCPYPYLVVEDERGRRWALSVIEVDEYGKVTKYGRRITKAGLLNQRENSTEMPSHRWARTTQGERWVEIQYRLVTDEHGKQVTIG